VWRAFSCAVEWAHGLSAKVWLVRKLLETGTAYRGAAMGIDFYEVYLEVEEEFDIHFVDNPALVPVEHVGELFDVMLRALREQHPERFNTDGRYDERAWDQYKSLLVNQLGLRPEQVVRSAHFIRDLKLY
jgi:hypothetical protein